ncbi:MAG TPA: MFS transporter [Mycobacteriales bacterium]|nr:MFS transporter [Mycobacteriales bacterium]
MLREPHFGQLYATRLTSQTSDGVFNVALAGFALFSPERQTSPGEIAAAFATLLLPYSIVGPFAGVLIDRWSRQRILVVANLVRAVLILGVIGIVVSDVPTPLFYGAALLVLSVNRFLLSALSAALPHVVQRPMLVLANALSTTSGTVAAIFGGALGTGLRRLVGADDRGVAVVLAAAAGGYVAAALVAARMDAGLLGPDGATAQHHLREEMRRVLRGVGEGAQHVWHRRRAGLALAAIASHRFCYGVSFIATVLLYNEDYGAFGTGIRGLGAVIGASAAGYLTAAVVTPTATRRVGVERWIALLFGGAAIAEIVFGLPYTEPALLAAAFALGIAAQGSKICVDTIVQQSIDDEFRGRVFSFYDIVFNVSFVAAAGVTAVVVPRDGRSRTAVVAIATGYAVTAIAYAAAVRRTTPDD